jgi:hypothetical protein
MRQRSRWRRRFMLAVFSVGVVTSLGCQLEVSAPLAEQTAKHVVTDGGDYPIYSAFNQIGIDCPAMGSRLRSMFTNGEITFGGVATFGADAETTWNYNPSTGAREPGSERIAIGQWMEWDVEGLTYLLRHEYGHVTGIDGHNSDGNTGYESSCNVN